MKKEYTPLKLALHYRKNGYSVIPVGADKKPMFSWKEFTERKASKDEIKKWYKKFPRAGVAIITGKISGITVIDVEKGGAFDYLPETFTIRTGGGGFHFYYTYSPKFKNLVRIRELTDIRNDGGYVIAPPSRHANGRRYKFKKVRELAQFPDHLFISESIKEVKEGKFDEFFKPAVKGERNSRTAQVAGKILTSVPFHLWEQIAWPSLKSWNDSGADPLDEKELRAVYDSISSRVTFQQEDTERPIENLDTLKSQYRDKLRDIKDGVSLSVPTGFSDLDFILNGGMKKGDLVLVGARPSVGKTSLAVSMAYNAAIKGFSVLFFSLEMTSLDLYEKFLSIATNYSYSDIVTGQAPEEVIAKGMKKIDSLKIEIAELVKATTLTITEIVKQKLLENKIDIIIVDYLHLLRDKGNDKENIRVGRISKNLKVLARMTKIPVVALAQLRREADNRKGQVPQLSDLKESGDLEADADIVLLIHRDRLDDKQNEAEVIVAKHRKGPTGKLQMVFDLKTTRFKSNAISNKHQNPGL